MPGAFLTDSVSCESPSNNADCDVLRVGAITLLRFKDLTWHVHGTYKWVTERWNELMSDTFCWLKRLQLKEETFLAWIFRAHS